MTSLGLNLTDAPIFRYGTCFRATQLSTVRRETLQAFAICGAVNRVKSAGASIGVIFLYGLFIERND